MKIRKITAWVILLTMVLTMLPAQVFADTTVVASGSCGENLTWVLDDAGTLTISGTGDMENYRYHAPWESYLASITNVTIEHGVTSVGDYAFPRCQYLTNVTISDSVTTIGKYAFYYCRGLTNVTIGNGVTSIGSYAFADSAGIDIIWFEGSAPEIAENAFSEVFSTICYPAEDETWTEAVMQNYGGILTWVAVGELVGLEIMSLPQLSYYQNEELDLSGLRVAMNFSNGAQIEVPSDNLAVTPCDMSVVGKNTVTVSYGGMSVSFTVYVHEGELVSFVLDPEFYPESTHNYANNLDEIQTITYAGARMLYLEFSNNSVVEFRQDYVVIYDGNDNEIVSFTGGLDKFGIYVAGDTAKIRLVSDGEGTDYGYSFANITAYSVVHTGSEVAAAEPTCTVPGHTTGILCEICDQYSYQVIPALGHAYESVETPATPEENGYITHTCTRCGHIYVEELVWDTIASGTCGANLTWVLTGEGTLTISGEGEMSNYRGPRAPWYSFLEQIETVVIEPGATTIGDGAFIECTSMISISIPDSVTYIGDYSFYECIGLASVNIPDSVTGIGEGAFEKCEGLTSAVIGDGVTAVGNSAFRYCGSLASLTIGDSVASIGDNAFTACTSLTSVIIPDSVTTIGREAFYYCINVTDVTIGNGVTSTGDSTFKRCTSLETVTVGDSVTEIGFYAFADCYALRTVVLPKSLTYVWSCAFLECSNLEQVFYKGTPEEWERVWIDGNMELRNAAVVYNYSDGNSISDGWYAENGLWYFYQNGQKVTGWLQVGGIWYFMDTEGIMQTGWIQDGGKWYYMDAYGAMQSGWLCQNGVWYYLNNHMVTGWQQIGGVWYYFNASGAMQSGWLLDGGVWYYLNNHMATGWQNIGGYWYYFNANGAMQSGWLLDGGKWYYLNNHMITGWLRLGNTWYYLDANGAMVTGSYVIDGVTYYFDASGAWIP